MNMGNWTVKGSVTHISCTIFCLFLFFHIIK